MKKLPGSLIIFYILSVLLNANEGYKIDVQYSPKRVYANQAMNLDIVCKFDGSGNGMDFIFTPPNINDVVFTLVQDSENFKGSKKIINLHYLVEFKKDGFYNIKLKASMRKTNSQQLREASTGRDLGPNSIKVQYEQESISLQSIRINVLKSAPLTGIFSLNTTVLKTNTQAYEPTQLKIELTSNTNKNTLLPFTLNIADTTIFADKPKIDFTANRDGFNSKLTQHFAISATKDFTIPSFSIEYFDIKKKKIVKLETKPIEINVVSVNKKNLVDKKNFPEPKKPIDWNSYLNYIFWYLFGVLSVIVFIFLKRKKVTTSPVLDIVKSTNEPKELLKVLLTLQDQQIDECIKDLENSIYAKKDITMSKIKKRILQKLGEH